MNIEIVLNILSIIISIITLCISINILKRLKPNKIKEESNEIDLDEKLNSLEFNTHLDNIIRPLLGKLNNEDIAEKVSEKVIMYDFKTANKSDMNKIKNYISDLLLVYNNHIDIKESSITPDEIIQISEYNDDKKISKRNEFDLSTTINNFYRD